MIFYWAGKNKYGMVTADFPSKGYLHIKRPITLGRTAVFAFTGKTYNSTIRGKAFLDARSKILRL